MIVAIDFETFYDVDYTLKKLSTSEYIRDEQFKVHMMGLKIDDQPTQVLHPDDIPGALAAIDWTQASLLCHHTAFDGFILQHHYGVVPSRYLCTLSMARGAMPGLGSYALDSLSKLFGRSGKLAGRLEDTKGIHQLSPELFDRLAEYCAQDVEDNVYIYHQLSQRYPEPELQLIDLTIRMFCCPVLEVDQKLADEELGEEIGGKVAALLHSGVSAERLMSNQKFAELLQEHGVAAPAKYSKTTGQLTYAFAKNDQAFRALLHHPSETVRRIVEARLKIKSTIRETRAKRLLEEAKDGPLPVYLSYYGAHTGRWSGGNKMNLQNLPRGGRLRRALRAPEGFVLCVADSAQIEARVTAWLAEQTDLLSAFAARADVYSQFASRIYGRKIDRKYWELDADGNKVYPMFNEGFVGKTCILGLGFGMGAQRLRETLLNGTPSVDLPLNACIQAVELYRTTYDRIPELWSQMSVALGQMLPNSRGGGYKCLRWGPGRIKLPNNMFLLYNGLFVDERRDFYYQAGKAVSKIYGGLLTENVVQALARVIVAEQMLKISERYRIVTMSHDEVVALVPEAEADAGLLFMLETMSVPPTWAPDLPLFAEGGYDVCYSK